MGVEDMKTDRRKGVKKRETWTLREMDVEGERE